MSANEKSTQLISESTFSRLTTLIWTALGAGVLYFTKYLNDDAVWIPAIFCAGLILLFALIIFIMYGAAQRTRLADNCYYMGLIYTLISMVIVLIQVGDSRDSNGETDDVYRVLGAFGIALTSTIAGILARLLLQSQPGLGDDGTSDSKTPVEGIAQPMDDAARTIRMEVMLLKEAFQELRVSMVSAAEENKTAMYILKNTFTENIGVLKKSTSDVEASMTGLATVTDKAKSGLDAFARIDPEKLNKVAIVLGEIGGVARDARNAIERKTSEVVQEIDRTAAVLDLLRKSYSSLKEEADKNATTLSELQENSADASDKYIASMGKIMVNIGDLEKATATAGSAIQDLGKSAAGAQENLFEFSRFEPVHMQEILGQYGNLAAHIKREGQQLVKSFGEALKSTKDLTKELQSMLSNIQEANAQRERAELLELVSDVSIELKELRKSTEAEKGEERKRRRKWWLLWLR